MTWHTNMTGGPSDRPQQCPARSPDGEQCAKPRGHKRAMHKAADPASRTWTGGIRARAWWNTTVTSPEPDNGYMSEADYETWGRL